MRDAEGLETMKGMKYLASVPDGEIIEHITTHDGKLFVATNKHIYILEDEKRLKKVDQ